MACNVSMVMKTRVLLVIVSMVKRLYRSSELRYFLTRKMAKKGQESPGFLKCPEIWICAHFEFLLLWLFNCC